MFKLIPAPAILLLLVLLSCHAQSQTVGEFKYDETELYAETKQVNQFFRRFNGEEDKQGERLYVKDKDFRTYKLRKKYVPGLFNLENSILTDAAKEKFSALVLDKENPTYLDFHGGAWLCELKTVFTYQGVEDELTMFLVLQEEEVGSKWVIDGIYFEPFNDVLKQPDNSNFNDKKFLHPLSHELGFMNMFRVFNESDSLEYFGKLMAFRSRGANYGRESLGEFMPGCYARAFEHESNYWWYIGAAWLTTLSRFGVENGKHLRTLIKKRGVFANHRRDEAVG